VVTKTKLQSTVVKAIGGDLREGKLGLPPLFRYFHSNNLAEVAFIVFKYLLSDRHPSFPRSHSGHIMPYYSRITFLLISTISFLLWVVASTECLKVSAHLNHSTAIVTQTNLNYARCCFPQTSFSFASFGLMSLVCNFSFG
jgi:hypothetical protein